MRLRSLHIRRTRVLEWRRSGDAEGLLSRCVRIFDPGGAGGAERGFTLIEVLIALFLTAILLSSIYFTFFSMLESREVISEDLERQREVRRFIDFMGMEIESAYVSDINAYTRFVGSKAEIGGRSFSTLEFTFFTHTVVSKGSPSGDLKSVRYSVGKGDGEKIDLFKERWDAFTGQGGKGSFKVEAVEDIKGFDVSYFNEGNWVKSWRNAPGRGTPEAVSFVLTVGKGHGTEKYTFTVKPRIKTNSAGVRRVASVSGEMPGVAVGGGR